MSDPHVSGSTSCPWLAVAIDHNFRHGGSSFHLGIRFDAHSTRTVVFGPSGSGKSSLLRAIAGLLTPDSGTIEIREHIAFQKTQGSPDILVVPPEKRRVGLVMQNPAVFPHLTAARNVAFPLNGMDNPARQEKILQLLNLVEAESLASRWPRELSGGQLQRVAIARTLAAEPSILLLDEPFAALDSESRQRLSQRLHAWARERNVPVLTVTHNLEEAFAAGDEVLTIKDGRITAQGHPQEVLATERNSLLIAMGMGRPPASAGE